MKIEVEGKEENGRREGERGGEEKTKSVPPLGALAVPRHRVWRGPCWVEKLAGLR